MPVGSAVSNMRSNRNGRVTFTKGKGTVMFVTPLFKLMSDKQASDMFFTVGWPIQIKINGQVMPINSQVLDAEQCKKICYELMTEAQVKEFETVQEMNFAQSAGDLGNFRVNIFRQKSTVAMVIRFVKPDVPAIESLGLPLILKEIIMEKLGLILVVGATGSGKSDDGLDDRLPQWPQDRPHPHDRGPDRVRVQAQEI